VPVRESNDFFDLAFQARLSERTRLIIINSPANPTGGNRWLTWSNCSGSPGA
jgi:aspartate/methionine/tyrosine aminotransferase